MDPITVYNCEDCREPVVMTATGLRKTCRCGTGMHGAYVVETLDQRTRLELAACGRNARQAPLTDQFVRQVRF